MLVSIVQIIIAALGLLILFYAYFRNNTLGKLAVFIILTAIFLIQFLNGFAGLIADVDFLNFLESIFRGIADLVVYVELAALVFVMFFTKHKSKEVILKYALIGYIVLVLLIEFGVFK